MNYAFYKVVTQKRYCKPVSFKYDNATGGGQDNTTDPGPKRDPNDYLAPIFGNSIFTSLASIAAILIVVILILVAVRMLKHEL